MATIMMPKQPSADSGDIVEIILSDHMLVEQHFRAMRDRTSNRTELLQSFANLLLSHSDAEEELVYPRIREVAKAADESKKEQKPDSEAQHTEALMALQALMETDPADVSSWENKLELLILGVMKHAAEEEMTLLNVARLDMSAQQRAELGAAFQAAKQQKLALSIGNIDNVRKLVKDRATMMQQLKQTLSG